MHFDSEDFFHFVDANDKQIFVISVINFIQLLIYPWNTNNSIVYISVSSEQEKIHQ